MEIDSTELRANTKGIPENVQTIIDFRLPYAVPLPDGLYEMKLDGKTADIVVKRVQITQIEGITGTGTAQIQFDKYGRSSFSSVSMKFPWKMDLEENGRKPLLLGDIPPRRKFKQTILRFLNRFIDAVRYSTQEYWVERARYQDILSYNVSYWDGKKRYPAGRMMIDTGVGGIRIGGKPFQIKEEKLDELKEMLSKELPLDASRIFLLNSKDACLQEDFRLAMIEGVAALEIVLYNFIKVQGKNLDIAEKELEEFIVKVGLTGNITIVMKALSKDLEQIDKDTLRECTGAIRIRNKILHEGLMDVGSTDTEKRILVIEKMVDYLRRITPAS